jgi:hypothetical protein
MSKNIYYILVSFVVIVLITMSVVPAKAEAVNSLVIRRLLAKRLLIAKITASKPKIEVKKEGPQELSVLVTDANYQDLLIKTQTFLSRYAVGTKVSAELIVNIAKDNKFPLDLLLIQGHIESNWCTKGRARTSNMCINVGAYDRGDTIATTCHDGTTWCVSDYAVGLQIDSDRMSKCWFTPSQKITIDNFIKNDFRIQQRGDSRCGPVGGRYATSPAYQSHFVNSVQNLFNPIFN